MGLISSIWQFFFGEGSLSPDLEEGLIKELDESNKILFLNYNMSRRDMDFARATKTLESLLTTDSNETHKEYYRYLIEEMRIYLESSQPESSKENRSDERSSQYPNVPPQMTRTNQGGMDYKFRGPEGGKIGHRPRGPNE